MVRCWGDYLFCFWCTATLWYISYTAIYQQDFFFHFFGDLSRDSLYIKMETWILSQLKTGDWSPSLAEHRVVYQPSLASRSHMHNTCCAMSVCLLGKKKKSCPLQQKCEKLTANGFARQPQERWVNLSGSRIHDARMFSTWSFQTGQEEHSPWMDDLVKVWGLFYLHGYPYKGRA